MYDTKSIRLAADEYLNPVLRETGPRFRYFLDYSPKQVKHAVKSYVFDLSIDKVEEYFGLPRYAANEYFLLMDTSGILHSGKKRLCTL